MKNVQIVIFRRYRLEPGSRQEGFSRYVFERDLFLSKARSRTFVLAGCFCSSPRQRVDSFLRNFGRYLSSCRHRNRTRVQHQSIIQNQILFIQLRLFNRRCAVPSLINRLALKILTILINTLLTLLVMTKRTVMYPS